MGTRELKAFCAFDDATLELLKMAMNELKLNARACDRILKVARSIADLGDQTGSPRTTSPKQFSIVRSTGNCGLEHLRQN
jgi:predicted ATPase with chaperone activity